MPEVDSVGVALPPAPRASPASATTAWGIAGRPLLLIGSTGMEVTLATMAVIFGTAPVNDAGTPDLSGAAGPIAVVAANLFVVSFGMSWGPIVWVLLGESFPNRIRAAALGLAAGTQWVAKWLITVSFRAQGQGVGANEALDHRPVARAPLKCAVNTVLATRVDDSMR